MSNLLRNITVAALLVAGCSPSESAPTTEPPATSTTVAPTTTTTSSAPSTTTTTIAPLPEHRIQVRVIDGVGEFYDITTGDKFVPRGMNYNRFLPSASGQILDSVVSTRHYDRETIKADFITMKGLGYNVVRIMIDTCGIYVDGCITGSDHRLNPDYVDNLVSFLELAKQEKLFVMVASNTLPDDSYWIYETAALVDATFDSANNEFLNPAAVPFYVDYWESVVQALVDRAAPLDIIWAYELRQEHHFHLNYAPLSLSTGMVTTANGNTYDMAVAADKVRMVDEGLVYWADLIRSSIRSIDPTAPVTVGFFTPNSPNPVLGPLETRLVQTNYFLRNSEVDFVDLHHYPGNGVDDALVWENFGIAGVDEMPIVLGEFGAYASWWSGTVRAAAAVMGMEVDSCRVGFDGWLEWAWRGDLATDIYWAVDGAGEIAQVLSPNERPDPCEHGSFDFIRYNVASTATITASSSDPSFPAGKAIDGTPTYWNAAGDAPQWVELALPTPSNIEEIRLVVAQDPASRSVHEVWVQQTGGTLDLVETFDGTTSTGDVLSYKPAALMTNVELVRVVTTSLVGLAPAWQEIELLSPTPPA